MSREERQAWLKQAYGRLYTEVSRLVREADPIRLIAIGAPDDEYDVEIGAILPRLCEATSAGDVHRIVHEEFVRCFDADIAGPPEIYAAMSVEIWQTWGQFPGAPPNKAVPADAAKRPPAADRRRPLERRIDDK
jgi:hypothetical protein